VPEGRCRDRFNQSGVEEEAAMKRSRKLSIVGLHEIGTPARLLIKRDTTSPRTADTNSVAVRSATFSWALCGITGPVLVVEDLAAIGPSLRRRSHGHRVRAASHGHESPRPVGHP
jgi:hypothetical protein